MYPEDMIDHHRYSIISSYHSLQFKHMTFHIHLYSSPSMAGYIMNSQCGQLSVGLIAQLVEHCTGMTEVMGLNPV